MCHAIFVILQFNNVKHMWKSCEIIMTYTVAYVGSSHAVKICETHGGAGTLHAPAPKMVYEQEIPRLWRP